MALISILFSTFCPSATAIVERSRFPTTEEAYGDVEVIVQDEDELDLSEPVIKPKDTKVVDYQIEDVEKHPQTHFDKTFLFDCTKKPQIIRNVCFVGPLHSGKTSIFDMFVACTHVKTQPV